MALNGIDISSWQAGLNAGAIQADFVIIKATEGGDYVNPVCDTHYQQAKAAGKLLGVYHFADHGDAIVEADYFVDNVAGYVGEAILVLDWEGNFTADVAWAKTWLDHVHERTGVKPLIYMSESVVNAHDWSSVIDADYGLWVARYADMVADYNYDLSAAGAEPSVDWGSAGYALWQWTSAGRLNGYGANLDLDIFYGDAAAWHAYAAVPAAPAPAPAVQPVEVTVQPNEQDGAVPVTTPTPAVALPAVADVPVDQLVTLPPVAVPPLDFNPPSVTKTAAVRGYRTSIQTIAGGAVATTTAILAIPQVQAILSTSLNKYVAPALLGLGISSGLVAFVMNLVEEKWLPKR